MENNENKKMGKSLTKIGKLRKSITSNSNISEGNVFYKIFRRSVS